MIYAVNSSQRKRRPVIGRLARLLLIVVIMALASPYALVLIYRYMDPPASALMIWRGLEGQPMIQTWRPLETISPNLITAVAASEDARICEHGGVDWAVLESLIEARIEDGDAGVRGGSTIAMQTAKNLFLWPQRSYVRKALEIPLAQWIGYVWPKQRIMEVYLNIVEWGPGIYGAEAATQHHFKRAANSTSKRQATLLAAALPAPLRRQAGKPSPGLSKQARRLQRRLTSSRAHLDCLFARN